MNNYLDGYLLFPAICLPMSSFALISAFTVEVQAICALSRSSCIPSEFLVQFHGSDPIQEQA